MIGIIPAAGKGKRLGGKTKSLLLIKGKRVIHHILDNMKSIGIKKVYIIQFKNSIKKVIGSKYRGLEIKYLQQNKQTGLKDAIMKCSNLKGKMCIILGDIIYKPFEEDLKDARIIFEEMSDRKDAIAMVTYKVVEDKEQIKKSYGFLKSPYSNYTKAIIEKPKDIDKIYNYLGLGIYFVTHEIFKYLKSKDIFMNVFNRIRNETVMQQLNGEYYNINTLEEFEDANR